MGFREQHNQYLQQLEVGTGETELDIIKAFINLMIEEPSINKELYDMIGEINGYINDLEHEHEAAKENGASVEYLTDIQNMIGETRNVRRRVSNRQSISKVILEALDSPTVRPKILEINQKVESLLSINKTPIYRFKSSGSGVSLKYLLERNKQSAEEFNVKSQSASK